MLNQGLDPQGLRYAAAGTQYQHAQQNFQALGGLQQGLQGLAAGGRMGLAGFPNTSAAPQQGQFHAGGLAGGAAGLAQQGLRFMAPGVPLGGGQLPGQGFSGINAQRAQGLGQGIGQGLGQGIGQGLNLGSAVRAGANPQQATAALLMQQQQQQRQQQQQFGAAAQQFAGGLGNLGGNPLQQLNAAQRQLALQQQQQPQQQQQQQQQNDLLALLAGGGKTAGGHAGFSQLGGLSGLAATSPANAGASVQASHALFGRPGGFAGAAAAGLGGQGAAGGLGGLHAATAASLAAAAAGQGGTGNSALDGLTGGNAATTGQSAAQQQQQQQQSAAGAGGSAGQGGPGFSADEFPALGAAAQAAAAARGAASVQQQQGPGVQQQQGGPAGPRSGGADYSAAAMALKRAAGIGGGQAEFSIQNDSDFPALGGANAAGADAGGERDASKQDAAKGEGGVKPGDGLLGSPLPGGAGALAPGAAAAIGADRYGLLGLLHVIRMTEPDLTMLALGTDLTGLGLNLNAPDSLYKVLVSPLADNPVRADLDFEVPACYKHNPPRLQPGYLAKFKEETLFYIFYSMPQDEAQLIAADELCARGWWWHKKFRCWFIHAPNNPVVKSAANRSERGTYLFFDTNIWDVVQKSDVEVFFEDVERPPGLPRNNMAAAGATGAAAGAAANPAAAAAGGVSNVLRQ